MKFFRRKNDNDAFSLTDDFGEWIIIRRNPTLTLLKTVIEKAMKKMKIKDWDFSVIYYTEDEKIKGLFSLKGMLSFPDHIRELDFYNAFKSVTPESFLLGEMRLSRLRVCNTTFLFLYVDFLLKKAPKEEEDQIKLLLPPKGIYGCEIPYSMRDLFLKLAERNLNASCNSLTLTLNNGNFESIYQCKSSKELDLSSLKETMSYFSVEDPNITVRSNIARQVEVQITINKFKTKYLIPLLWGNVLASNIVC